jgi:hypothetical protein
VHDAGPTPQFREHVNGSSVVSATRRLWFLGHEFIRGPAAVVHGKGLTDAPVRIAYPVAGTGIAICCPLLDIPHFEGCVMKGA